MAKTMVGIDISANGLRGVELANATKGKPTLLRQHAVALPPGAVSKGEVVDAKAVASALRQLWSAGGFKGKDVVLGIGNSRVFARDLTVPKMSLERIRESLPFQTQDMLPFPVESAVLDFYPINEGDVDGNAVVNGLLVAALRDVILGNVKAAQLAGLNPIDVDLVPFALSRVLLRGSSAVGTAAIIDVGASTTTVVVSSEGVPRFVRIIPTGGDDLTLALSQRLAITIEQAEATKRSVGMIARSADQQEVANIIRELATELITSLRSTLAYFAGAKVSDMIDRIVLTGGGSVLDGFSAALAEFTGLPVTLGDPLEAVNVLGKSNRTALASGRGAGLSVAIGLALGSAA
jgi:type IV pilus assembly protein PilM